MKETSINYSLDDLATLLKVSRDIGPSLDLDTLLRRIEEATLRVIACERVTVFVVNRERGELRSRLATGGREIRVGLDSGLAAEAFRTRQVISSPDVTRDPRFNSEVDRSTGFQTRSLLAVPLVGFDKQLVGVIEFLNKGREGFTEADEEMAATLASLTAVALQRQMLLEEWSEKQKLERDLAMARRIQQSLLPERDPIIEGFDIAGWSKAANVVGGDFYDYIWLDHGSRLGIMVGDAIGHGLDSALLACECRALVEAIASMTGDLRTIIGRTSEVLHADLKAERFVTLFLGDLDIAAHWLTYVSAGCAPLFYQASRRKCCYMSATTLPLGIRAPVDGNPAHSLRLKTGDILTLVTDGFDEWPNVAGDRFGREKIVDIVREHSSERAEGLIKRLHEAVIEFSRGTRQEDDLTAVVVKKV